MITTQTHHNNINQQQHHNTTYAHNTSCGIKPQHNQTPTHTHTSRYTSIKLHQHNAICDMHNTITQYMLNKYMATPSCSNQRCNNNTDNHNYSLSIINMDFHIGSQQLSINLVCKMSSHSDLYNLIKQHTSTQYYKQFIHASTHCQTALTLATILYTRHTAWQLPTLHVCQQLNNIH